MRTPTRSLALLAAVAVAALALTGCGAGSDSKTSVTSDTPPPQIELQIPDSSVPLTDTTTLYRGKVLHCIGINRADWNNSSTAAFSCDLTRFYDENPDLLQHPPASAPR
jgi:hypothetical protein